MKINEILVESNLEEGPILNKIGSAIGKGVGTLAKGVGAVAGGAVGLGSALKKGFYAGHKAVSGGGDDEEGGTTSSAPRSSSAPAAQPAAQPAPKAQPAAEPAATGGDATGAKPAPAAEPAATGGDATGAKPAPTPAAKKTAGPSGVAQAEQPAANDTAYAQAQKAVGSLPPDQKQQIIAMLQSDPKVKAAMARPAAGTKESPNAKFWKQGKHSSGNPFRGNDNFDDKTGEPIPPEFKNNRPAAKKPVAKKPAPTAPVAKKPAAKPATAKMGTVQQKQLTPTGFGQMVGGLTKQNASVERTGKIIRENFSLFRKR